MNGHTHLPILVFLLGVVWNTHFVDLVEMYLSPFIVDVRNGFVLFLVVAGDIALSVQCQINFSIFQELDIAVSELFQPSLGEAWSQVESVKAPSGLIFIVCHPIAAGAVDNHPFILESPHRDVRKDHGSTSTSFPTEKHILEAGCVPEVRRILCNSVLEIENTRRQIHDFIPIIEISWRWRHLHIDDFLDSLIQCF